MIFYSFAAFKIPRVRLLTCSRSALPPLGWGVLVVFWVVPCLPLEDRVALTLASSRPLFLLRPKAPGCSSPVLISLLLFPFSHITAEVSNVHQVGFACPRILVIPPFN